MPSSPKSYNPRVFYIEDEDERDQCQFVHVPRNGEKPERCQKDGMYRIGLVIFLCGWHMPGVGRHPGAEPIKIRKLEKAAGADEIINPQNDLGTVQQRLLIYFKANAGLTLSYAQIMESFPNLDNRQYISIAVTRLRREGAVIKNVPYVGYIYSDGTN